MQQSAAAVEPDEHTCPLCRRTFRRLAKRAKTLYGVRVCGKCRNGFASRRQGAFLIDWVIFYVAVTALLILGEWVFFDVVSAGTFGFAASTRAVWVFDMLLGSGAWVLFLFKDGFEGRSPGKRLLGIEVVDRITMQPVGFRKSLARNLPLLPIFIILAVLLLVPAYMLPLRVLIILAVLLLAPAFILLKGPRWGDARAGTKVVWRRYRQRLPFDQLGVFCQSCGYNLTGNVSGICSECGTPIPGPPRAIPVVPPPSGKSGE